MPGFAAIGGIGGGGGNGPDVWLELKESGSGGSSFAGISPRVKPPRSRRRLGLLVILEPVAILNWGLVEDFPGWLLNTCDGSGGSFVCFVLRSLRKGLLRIASLPRLVDRFAIFQEDPPSEGRGSNDGKSPRDWLLEDSDGSAGKEEDAEGDEGDSGFSC